MAHERAFLFGNSRIKKISFVYVGAPTERIAAGSKFRFNRADVKSELGNVAVGGKRV